MNAQVRRPKVEEFIRLASNPTHYWGMADSDIVALCDYILHLERGATAASRRVVHCGAKYYVDDGHGDIGTKCPYRNPDCPSCHQESDNELASTPGRLK